MRACTAVRVCVRNVCACMRVACPCACLCVRVCPCVGVSVCARRCAYGYPQAYSHAPVGVRRCTQVRARVYPRVYMGAGGRVYA
jgi:hypothetical protein